MKTRKEDRRIITRCDSWAEEPARAIRDDRPEFGGSPLRGRRDYGRTASAFADPLSELGGFAYGMLRRDGRFVTDLEEMDAADAGEFMVQTPRQYLMRQAGMCHDASVFVDRTLTLIGTDHMCFFCSSHEPPRYATHSWVAFRQPNGRWRNCDPCSYAGALSEREYGSWEEAGDGRFAEWLMEQGIRRPEDARLMRAENMPRGGVALPEFIGRVESSFLGRQ